MKNLRTFLLALALIFAMLLAGCAKQSALPLEQPAVLEKCEKITDYGVKSRCYLYAGMLQQNKNFCQKTNEADAETCYLSLAVTEKDISFCDKISLGKLAFGRDFCYANFVMRVSFNSEDCGKISSAQIKEQCVSAANRLKDCEAEGGKYRIPCYIAHALAERNPDSCNKLDTVAYQENCKSQVHSLLAGLNNDESECDKISDAGDVAPGTSLRASCLMSLSIWRGDDGALCARVPEKYQSACFENYATSLLDTAICGKAGEGANDCLNQVAQSTGDVSICRRITNIDGKDSCIAMLAILGKLSDNDACREIVNDDRRAKCLEYVKG